MKGHVKPTREALEDLRAKYQEMLRLRVAHSLPDEPDPRREMAALAARFPGALREIDELPLHEISARMDALAEAVHDPSSAPPWMEAHALFHALMRGALAAKRWLAGRKTVDPATRATFLRVASSLRHGNDARAWVDELHRIAAPPGGRITDLVVERMSAILTLSAREVRLLVYGASRGERRSRRGGA